MVGVLLTAWLFHHVGFHAMLGSFCFGLTFPRGTGTPFLYTILQKAPQRLLPPPSPPAASHPGS